MRVFILLALLPLLCGCYESGTWQNDAKNWMRVFHQETPKDITVVHSWYWRSPHFTYEFECFFELAPNETFRQRALESGRLLNFTPDANTTKREQLQRFFNDKPSWFIPKPIESYEVWHGKPPEENFPKLETAQEHPIDDAAACWHQKKL